MTPLSRFLLLCVQRSIRFGAAGPMRSIIFEGGAPSRQFQKSTGRPLRLSFIIITLPRMLKQSMMLTRSFSQHSARARPETGQSKPGEGQRKEEEPSEVLVPNAFTRVTRVPVCCLFQKEM